MTVNNKNRFFLILACLAALLLWGCASQEGARQVLLNTPAQHASNGVRLLDSGKPKDAKREFELAQAGNRNYAMAYTGLSIVASRTGDFEEAVRLLDKAASLAVQGWERTQVEIARMELNLNQEQPGWLDRIETAYTRGTSLTPHAPRATYILAEAYLKAHRFDLARRRFAQVAETDDSLAFTARAGLELCDKVLEAEPRTDLGRRMALVQAVNRAQMAALLVAETSLNWPEPQKNPPATDYRADMPEAEAINKVLTSRLPGFPLSGGGAFVPPMLIKRQDLALIALGLTKALAARPDLDNGCFVAGLTDLPADDTYAQAVCFCVSWNIMDRITWSRFEPQATVSGATALVTIRRAERLGLRLKESSK